MSSASFGTVNATGMNVTGVLQAAEVRTTRPMQVSNLTATGLTSLTNVAVSGPATLSNLTVSSEKLYIGKPATGDLGKDAYAKPTGPYAVDVITTGASNVAFNIPRYASYDADNKVGFVEPSSWKFTSTGPNGESIGTPGPTTFTRDYPVSIFVPSARTDFEYSTYPYNTTADVNGTLPTTGQFASYTEDMLMSMLLPIQEIGATAFVGNLNLPGETFANIITAYTNFITTPTNETRSAFLALESIQKLKTMNRIYAKPFFNDVDGTSNAVVVPINDPNGNLPVGTGILHNSYNFATQMLDPSDYVPLEPERPDDFPWGKLPGNKFPVAIITSGDLYAPSDFETYTATELASHGVVVVLVPSEFNNIGFKRKFNTKSIMQQLIDSGETFDDPSYFMYGPNPTKLDEYMSVGYATRFDRYVQTLPHYNSPLNDGYGYNQIGPTQLISNIAGQYYIDTSGNLTSNLIDQTEYDANSGAAWMEQVFVTIQGILQHYPDLSANCNFKNATFRSFSQSSLVACVNELAHVNIIGNSGTYHPRWRDILRNPYTNAYTGLGVTWTTSKYRGQTGNLVPMFTFKSIVSFDNEGGKDVVLGALGTSRGALGGYFQKGFQLPTFLMTRDYGYSDQPSFMTPMTYALQKSDQRYIVPHIYHFTIPANAHSGLSYSYDDTSQTEFLVQSITLYKYDIPNYQNALDPSLTGLLNSGEYHASKFVNVRTIAEALFTLKWTGLRLTTIQEFQAMLPSISIAPQQLDGAPFVTGNRGLTINDQTIRSTEGSSNVSISCGLIVSGNTISFAGSSNVMTLGQWNKLFTL